MDWKEILDFLTSLAPWVQYVLMGLGTLVVVGFTYVKATPTKDDDAWWDRLESRAIIGPLLKALVSFSPLQRKKDSSD